MSGDPRLTRRAVLLGTLAVPLAACRGKDGGHRPTRGTPAVDEGELRAALEVEQSLLAAYDAASPTTEGMPYSLFRATHAAHADALAAALGGTPAPRSSTASVAPTSPPSTARALREREAATGKALTAAAVRATDGNVAALLASIAASHLAQAHMTFHQGGSR